MHNKKRRKKRFRLTRRRKRVLGRIGTGVMLVFAGIGVYVVLEFAATSLFFKNDPGGGLYSFSVGSATENITLEKKIMNPPDIKDDLLTKNEYSRPGKELKTVKGIVVHYTSNPGTTADQNRRYFENLKDTHLRKASSHYIIGIDGEIVRCIPEDEMSYCSNSRNKDTISIECCHPSEDGKFTKDTVSSLVHLTAFLIGKYDLGIEDVIRHYDVTGKECPKYYVDNEDAWDGLKDKIVSYIDTNGE